MRPDLLKFRGRLKINEQKLTVRCLWGPTRYDPGTSFLFCLHAPIESYPTETQCPKALLCR